jgi:hypothetical protein
MPNARITDPETSHEAAKSVSKLRYMYDTMIVAFETLGPMNDEQLIKLWRVGVNELGWRSASESGIRSRRSELVAQGKLKDSGKRQKMQSGRLSIVWEIA